MAQQRDLWAGSWQCWDFYFERRYSRKRSLSGSERVDLLLGFERLEYRVLLLHDIERNFVRDRRKYNHIENHFGFLDISHLGEAVNEMKKGMIGGWRARNWR